MFTQEKRLLFMLWLNMEQSRTMVKYRPSFSSMANGIIIVRKKYVFLIKFSHCQERKVCLNYLRFVGLFLFFVNSHSGVCCFYVTVQDREPGSVKTSASRNQIVKHNVKYHINYIRTRSVIAEMKHRAHVFLVCHHLP